MPADPLQIGIILEQGGALEIWARSGHEGIFMRDYIDVMIRDGFSITLFSYADHDPSRFNKPGFTILPGQGHRWLWTFLMPFRQAAHFRRMDALRVMHFTGALTAAIARRLTGVPYVTTYGYYAHRYLWREGARLRAVTWWLRTLMAIRSADAVFVTNADIAAWVKARCGNPDKVVYLPNGVDTTLFRPPETPPPAEPFTIAAVGRLAQIKRLDRLITAVAQLGPGVRLLLAGQGEEEQTLKTLAGEEGVQIEFAGVVKNDDLPAFLSHAHAYAITSEEEGNPKALLEAMSMGLPCVGTNVKGINNLITHGETGLLADSDPSDIAARLRSLLDDSALRAALGGAARAFILEHHDRHTLQERELNILRILAQRRRQARA